jgi:N-acetylmuramoyl-L-alanine amidase
MLRAIDYPSVILELSFLSNTEDFNFLTSEGGQNQLALSILKSVE